MAPRQYNVNILFVGKDDSEAPQSGPRVEPRQGQSLPEEKSESNRNEESARTSSNLRLSPEEECRHLRTAGNHDISENKEFLK